MTFLCLFKNYFSRQIENWRHCHGKIIFFDKIFKKNKFLLRLSKNKIKFKFFKKSLNKIFLKIKFPAGNKKELIW